MSIEWILITVSSTIAVVGIAYAINLSRKLRKSGYDLENQHAVLDDIRYSLEKQMYMLNDRLIQSEERWKDVNHLLLKGETDRISLKSEGPSRISLTNFLEANGITTNDLENINPRFIFVLTPFHDRWSDEFSAIRDTCTSLGYKCKRGDEDFFKGDIFPQMLQMILNAGIIIANINGRNANVMYELGVAQALDKKVILVSERPNELPIDIKSQRFVIYDDLNELQSLLKVELDKLS